MAPSQRSFHELCPVTINKRFGESYDESDCSGVRKYLSISFQSQWVEFSVEEVQLADRTLIADRAVKRDQQHQTAVLVPSGGSCGHTEPVCHLRDDAIGHAPELNGQNEIQKDALQSAKDVIVQTPEETDLVSQDSTTLSPAASSNSATVEDTLELTQEKTPVTAETKSNYPLHLHSLTIYIAGLLKLQEFYINKAVANAYAFQYVAEEHVATMHESGYRRTCGPFEDLKQAGVWWRMDEGDCIAIAVLGEAGRNIATVQVAKGTFVE